MRSRAAAASAAAAAEAAGEGSVAMGTHPHFRGNTDRFRASVRNSDGQSGRETPRYAAGGSEPHPGDGDGDRAEAPDGLPTHGSQQ